MIEILKLSFKCLMIFKFSAPYPCLLDDIEFCFHSRPIFRLLPSKMGTVKKKSKHCKKDGGQFRTSCVKEEEVLYEIQRSSCSNKFELIQKSRKGEGFALCSLRGSDFSVAHGGENDINRHKDSSKHKGYVDAAQQQRKLTDFGASSATANLGQKVMKAELIFSGFLVDHNLPLSTADHTTKIIRNMFPDSKIRNKR